MKFWFFLLVLFSVIQSVAPVNSMAVCANPGKDGAAGALGGIVNTYYRGNATVSAGATSISVNAADPYTTTGGSATAIAAGDLLLVIQMQDAAINSTNTAAYGDGSTGTGYTALNNAGRYEFVTATGPVTGGVVPVTPLINSYINAAATGTAGAKRFQIIRVPQYTTATLSGTNLTSIPWNGIVGGVLAIDVAGQLNWGTGSINVTGRGFRGGGGRQLAGGAGTLNTDYRTLYTVNANANKGEGIAGTPNRSFQPTPASSTSITITNAAGSVPNSGIEGYPNGSHARGAPGNAGGGATDGNPTANNQNAGGGGGAGYGSGGKGGNAWSSGATSGGFGGSGIAMSASMIIAGGGGGAGTTNDATGTPATAGFASSGAAGGGIVFIRANTVTGGTTITANGTNANSSVCQDGSGGGGGGGAVVVVASGGSGSVGTLTINAVGGKGGDNLQAGCGAHTAHGPGGGGGGGYVALSGSAFINTAGGANGITVGGVPFGATSGASGSNATSLTPSSIIGTSQTCLPIEVTKAPNVTTATPGTAITYSISYRNPNAYATQHSIVITDPIPKYMTYQSASCTSSPPGITCAAVFTAPPAGLMGKGLVTWTLTGTLNPLASGTVQVTAIIE